MVPKTLHKINIALIAMYDFQYFLITSFITILPPFHIDLVLDIIHYFVIILYEFLFLVFVHLLIHTSCSIALNTFFSVSTSRAERLSSKILTLLVFNSVRAI